MIIGTISAVDNSNGLQLTIDGEDAPTTKKYTYMASYVPAANDRVLIEEVSGSYVVMGKIIDDYTQSGVVRRATDSVNAENAENATNADYATTAQNLENATKVRGSLIANYHQSYNSQIGYYIDSIDITQSGEFIKVN